MGSAASEPLCWPETRSTALPSRNPPFASYPTTGGSPSRAASAIAARTYGEPMRVRTTFGKTPQRSTAVLLLTGVTTVRAPTKRAHSMPTRSPRSQVPLSSAMSGRSASPSVETMASSRCAVAQARP